MQGRQINCVEKATTGHKSPAPGAFEILFVVLFGVATAIPSLPLFRGADTNKVATVGSISLVIGHIMIGLFGFMLAIICALRTESDIKTILRIPRSVHDIAKHLAIGLPLGVVLCFVAMPVTSLSECICKSCGINVATQNIMNQILMSRESCLDFVIRCSISCLLAPFCEELLYRGILYNGLSARLRNPVMAAILASAFFAVLHIEVPFFLPLFVVGMAFCFAFNKYTFIGSLGMHMGFNAANLMIVLFNS